MSTIEKSLSFAIKAHAGQKDKVGAPYILHVLRVMLKQTGETSMMVAALHDSIEDNSACNPADLHKAGFSDAVVTAVDFLTRRTGETYEAYIQRVSKNPLARKVKIADLEDNVDILRLRQLGERDIERLQRYLDAWHVLKDG